MVDEKITIGELGGYTNNSPNKEGIKKVVKAINDGLSPDLSDYYTKEETQELISAIPQLEGGNGIDVSSNKINLKDWTFVEKTDLLNLLDENDNPTCDFLVYINGNSTEQYYVMLKGDKTEYCLSNANVLYYSDPTVSYLGFSIGQGFITTNSPGTKMSIPNMIKKLHTTPSQSYQKPYYSNKYFTFKTNNSTGVYTISCDYAYTGNTLDYYVEGITANYVKIYRR